MMTSVKLSTAKYSDRLVETSSADAGYPQSLMLRMMQNASRNMAGAVNPRRRVSKFQPGTSVPRQAPGSPLGCGA